MRARQLGIVRIAVQRGADRGGTEVDLRDQARRLVKALLVLAEGDGRGEERFAEHDRNSVL